MPHNLSSPSRIFATSNLHVPLLSGGWSTQAIELKTSSLTQQQLDAALFSIDDTTINHTVATLISCMHVNGLFMLFHSELSDITSINVTLNLDTKKVKVNDDFGTYTISGETKKIKFPLNFEIVDLGTSITSIQSDSNLVEIFNVDRFGSGNFGVFKGMAEKKKGKKRKKEEGEVKGGVKV